MTYDDFNNYLITMTYDYLIIGIQILNIAMFVGIILNDLFRYNIKFLIWLQRNHVILLQYKKIVLFRLLF